jgi:RND superfamily putative drug exporter
MNDEDHLVTPLAETPLGRLASRCYDARRAVLVVWVAVLVAVVAVGGFVVRGQFEDKFGQGHGDSRAAQDVLAQRFPASAGDTANIVFHAPAGVRESSVVGRIADVVGRVGRLPHVVGVRGPFVPGSGQVSPDGRTAYAVVQFDAKTASMSKGDLARVVTTARAAQRPGFEVELNGAPIDKALGINVGGSEYVGIVAAMLILLFAFGSLIAMGLPILTALFGLGVSIGIIDLFSRVLNVPTFGVELAAMIGLGVGIDYALFIVTRYRAALHSGHEPADAIAESLATSGRAVLFAGCTVVISLFGMMLLGQTFVYGLALGAISAVLLVMAAALTLLPALLGFAGRAIDRFHVPRILHRGTDSGPTFWYRWSRFIQRRPVLTGGAALVVLLLLAAPLLSLHMAFTDEGTMPTSITSRRAYDLLARGFGPGVNGPLFVAVTIPPGEEPALATLAERIAATPGVAHVTPPALNPTGDTALLVVTPRSAPQDQATQDLVHRLRTSVVPAVQRQTGTRVYIGGVTAAGIDVAGQFTERLWWVIVAVVAVSFLLLMAVFRSVVVPLKAAIMNLLSIGAAYGIVVAIFQWGWFGSVFSIGRPAPVDPWIPLMLFTILFGLSMDYEVFLLSRIREEWRRTGDNATAVANGLASTGRVITAAAAIMFFVFGSFVLSDVRVLKVFGLGLAAAVLVDATIIRCVLVPATMELLGDANWWMPRRLQRLVPTLGVEPELPEPEPELVGAGQQR